jgi:hypothetical protein
MDALLNLSQGITGPSLKAERSPQFPALSLAMQIALESVERSA